MGLLLAQSARGSSSTLSAAAPLREHPDRQLGPPPLQGMDKGGLLPWEGKGTGQHPQQRKPGVVPTCGAQGRWEAVQCPPLAALGIMLRRALTLRVRVAAVCHKYATVSAWLHLLPPSSGTWCCPWLSLPLALLCPSWAFCPCCVNPCSPGESEGQASPDLRPSGNTG